DRAGLEYDFKRTLIVVEDPFVLSHNPGSIFHEHYMPKWMTTLENVLDKWAIDEGNRVLMLTNPDLWDPTAPPNKSGTDSQEVKHLKEVLKQCQLELAKAAFRKY